MCVYVFVFLLVCFMFMAEGSYACVFVKVFVHVCVNMNV